MLQPPLEVGVPAVRIVFLADQNPGVTNRQSLPQHCRQVGQGITATGRGQFLATSCNRATRD